MLKLYFYLLQFLQKIQSCEENVKDKSSEEKPKVTIYVIFFWRSCIFVKIFYENCQF